MSEWQKVSGDSTVMQAIAQMVEKGPRYDEDTPAIDYREYREVKEFCEVLRHGAAPKYNEMKPDEVAALALLHELHRTRNETRKHIESAVELLLGYKAKVGVAEESRMREDALVQGIKKLMPDISAEKIKSFYW